MTIDILRHASPFAEDKDIAARIRDDELRPALRQGEHITLDFTGVEGATQSFVHALLSDVIRSLGPDVLDKIEFRSCNQTIRSIIEIVTQYSQLDSED